MLELLNIDCMEYMAGLEDNAFDLAIVDPPYGIDNKISTTSRENKGNKFAILYNKKRWDKKRPKEEYWNELLRVSKNQIVCGANYFSVYLPVSRGWILWEKLGGRMTSVNDELIYTSFDVSIKKFSRCHGLDKGFMNESIVIHPTQKPIRLYDWLLQNYAKPEMRILDTHLGSGSSAIAAHYFGCDFTGCEIDKDYFDSAQKRIDKETRQIAFKYD
tara:strand:- start:256 stop:903 length:648 start_codon:yes stop_codon:yes gene_type:complete